MNNNDQTLLVTLAKGDERAFEQLYRKYAKLLLQYVGSHTKDKDVSESIVQEIFASIWLRRDTLRIDENMEIYLKGAARHKILSHIRSEKMHQKYVEHFNIFLSQYESNAVEDASNVSELKAIIKNALKSLPPKCAHAFVLSRFEHKSLDEIADEMNISKRTVENYITQSLKHLRQVLKDYHWILLLLFCHSN